MNSQALISKAIIHHEGSYYSIITLAHKQKEAGKILSRGQLVTGGSGEHSINDVFCFQPIAMIHCAWSAWWLDPCSPGTGHLYIYLQLQQKMNRLLMQKQIGCSCKSNTAKFSWQCWSSLVSEEGYEHKDPALGVLEWYDRDDTGDDEGSGWTQKVVVVMMHSLHLNRFNWDLRKTTKQLTLSLHVQN